MFHNIFREILGLGLITLFFILKNIPPSIFIRITQPLLFIYIHVRNKHVYRIYIGIQRYWIRQYPNKPIPSKKEVLSHYYQNRLQLLSKHLIYYKNKQHLISPLKIQGIHHITNALREEKPILLLGLHMGLFEILHSFPWYQYLPEAEKKEIDFLEKIRSLTVLTSPAFSQKVSNHMEILRTSLDTKMNPSITKHVTHSLHLQKHLKKCLRNKNIFAYMGDQAAQNKESITLWNTIDIPVSTRLPQLFQKYHGITLPVFTYEKKGETYICCKSPLIVSENTPTAWEKSLQLFLEDSIEKAPYQWNWSYPKWSLNN